MASGQIIREMGMKRITTLGLALGAAIAFAGTAQADIKFGMTGPLTGPNAAFGAQLKNGVEQAVEDINAAGGILGQKIVLTYGDDVSDPKQGVSIANKFAGEGVKFVIGPFNSGVTMPASEVYQENGILEITPSATNPKITERGMWNIFRTCGRDDQQGAVAAAYIIKKFKGKKIAIVHDKTTYGQGLADETRKGLTKGGMKDVLYEGVNVGEKDYSALVSKIKASGADLVYWGGLHTEGGLIVRQMRDQGIKAPLMGGDGITTDEFASIGGPGVEGTLMTYGPDARKNPAAKAAVDKLHPLQLRGRRGHQAGGRAGEVARSQEGGRGDQVGQEVQDRDRRALLRQEGRRHPPRLRDVCLEEGSVRQDHLRRRVIAAFSAHSRESGNPESKNWVPAFTGTSAG
jgi:branched-chain amino acid transport system substrate-binding protein